MNSASNRALDLAKETPVASYATHRLLQSLCRRPDLIERLQTSPESVFEEFSIDERERAALRNPTPEVLAAIGVHPILQIHLMAARDPAFREQASVREFKNRIK